jgi:hypothetical protein
MVNAVNAGDELTAAVSGGHFVIIDMSATTFL